MAIWQRNWTSVGVRGFFDGDGRHAAALISAYFEAEHARATRQSVWRAVAICALVGWALSVATSRLNRIDLAFGVGLLACAVVSSGACEWRARRKLRALQLGSPRLTS